MNAIIFNKILSISSITHEFLTIYYSLHEIPKNAYFFYKRIIVYFMVYIA